MTEFSNLCNSLEMRSRLAAEVSNVCYEVVNAIRDVHVENSSLGSSSNVLTRHIWRQWRAPDHK